MSAPRAVVVVLAVAALFVALELRAVLRRDPGAHLHDDDAGGTAPPRRTGAPPAPMSADADVEPSLANVTTLHFPWSSATTGLGRVARAEGNAEGPAAFAVQPTGDVLILDGVNERIVLVSAAGERRSVKAPLGAIQDVAALPNRRFALLDRLVDRAVVLVDGDGNVFARVPLPSRAGDPGLVTGVFANRDVVCVEREHGACVPVASANGGPPPSERELPGRLASDGRSVLHAGIVAPGSSRVSLARSDAAPPMHRYTRDIAFASPVRSIEFLDANAARELYLGVVLESAPSTVLVLCLALESGEEVGRQELPASSLPDEVTRSFAVVESGGFLALQRTVDGADLRRYRCAP